MAVQCLRSPRATWAVQRRNVQRRGHLSASVRRELLAMETCSPDLNYTRGLADVSITALHSLRKETEPHLDCPGSCSISMIYQSGRAQRQSRDVQFSTDDPGASHMEGSASSNWSKPSFMIQVKMEAVHKTTGASQ